MGTWCRTALLAAAISWPQGAGADEVEIVAVAFGHLGGDRWNVDVTLRHDDTGWDHYADAWRVVDAESGRELGVRTLLHPHVAEQPFTRGLRIRVPPGTKALRVEARDLVHGWSPDQVEANLDADTGDRFEVSR